MTIDDRILDTLFDLYMGTNKLPLYAEIVDGEMLSWCDEAYGEATHILDTDGKVHEYDSWDES